MLKKAGARPTEQAEYEFGEPQAATVAACDLASNEKEAGAEYASGEAFSYPHLSGRDLPPSNLP